MDGDDEAGQQWVNNMWVLGIIRADHGFAFVGEHAPWGDVARTITRLGFGPLEPDDCSLYYGLGFMHPMELLPLDRAAPIDLVPYIWTLEERNALMLLCEVFLRDTLAWFTAQDPATAQIFWTQISTLSRLGYEWNWRQCRHQYLMIIADPVHVPNLAGPLNLVEAKMLAKCSEPPLDVPPPIQHHQEYPHQQASYPMAIIHPRPRNSRAWEWDVTLHPTAETCRLEIEVPQPEEEDPAPSAGPSCDMKFHFRR